RIGFAAGQIEGDDGESVGHVEAECIHDVPSRAIGERLSLARGKERAENQSRSVVNREVKMGVSTDHPGPPIANGHYSARAFWSSICATIHSGYRQRQRPNNPVRTGMK